MSTKVKAIPYVMKKDYISVVIDGKPFALDSTHATFSKLKAAIKAKNWARVPKLISIAQSIANESNGQISLEKGKLFYRKREINNALSQRILRMVKERKSVKHMLRFMDNLYKNPFGDESINEFFTWLERANLPITDDGHFIAYKSVTSDYKDCYSKKIDNAIGNIVTMPRGEVDASRMRGCSNGLHFCSRSYLGGFHDHGNRLLKIKINPADVVSIPVHETNKGRCMKYEVIGEIKDNVRDIVNDITDAVEFQTSVYPAAKNRQDLLKQILSHADVKRNIRRKKISKTSLLKSSSGRLQKMWEKLAKPELPKITEVVDRKTFLKNVRENYKLSINQVAKQMKVSYKTVAKLESDYTTSADYDKYIQAVEQLLGIYQKDLSAVSVPASAVM